jgi:hypothetical protein
VNPDPTPTLYERAEELEIAAKIAQHKGDYVFAQYLSREAHTLRMQAQTTEARNVA